MAQLSNEQRDVTDHELDEAAKSTALRFLIDCNNIGEAALGSAHHYDAAKRPHNVDMNRFELWAYAGKFFYEPVASREMATSRGEKDGSYGGQVGGPFVRFIQTLMMIVDGSEPTGHDVRTFIRHFRTDERLGKSVVAPCVVEDGHMVVVVGTTKVRLAA